jgi:hypothetical protein
VSISWIFRLGEHLFPQVGPLLTISAILYAFVVLVVFSTHREALKPGAGDAFSRRLRSLAGEEGWRERYRDVLARRLEWLNNRLGQHPWSAGSFDWTLRLALFYPIASLIFVWLVTGEDTSGISGLFAEHSLFRQRAIIALGLAIWLAFHFLASMASGWLVAMMYSAVAFAVAIATSYVYASLLDFDRLAAAGAAAVAASAFVLAGAFRGGFAFAGVLAAVFIIIAYFVGQPNALWWIAAIAAAFGVAYAERTCHKQGLAANFYVAHFVATSVAIGAIAWLAGKTDLPANVKMVLVFFLLIPLVNALFDWISLGSTRYFVGSIVAKGRTKKKTIYSLGLGLVLIIPLAVMVTAALQVLNLILENRGGHAWVDVSGILEHIYRDPSSVAVWWVYFMLLSTLVPTLGHALVVAITLIASEMPKSWREKVLADMTSPTFSSDSDKILWTSCFFTIRTMFGLTSLVLLGAGVAAGTLFALPSIGLGLLCICERTASLLGALEMLNVGACSALSPS